MSDAPHFHVELTKCRRGYLLTSGHRMSGMMGDLYAFDRIEDVAAWLVEHYTPAPEPEPEA